MIKNANITEATSARKPSTTMTAIAHLGKDEPPPFLCIDAPVPFGPCVEEDVIVPVGEADAAAAEDAEAREAEADEAEAAEADDIDATTESSNVVSNIQTCVLAPSNIGAEYVTRTDGGKGGLRNICVGNISIAPRDQPVERE